MEKILDSRLSLFENGVPCCVTCKNRDEWKCKVRMEEITDAKNQICSYYEKNDK